MRTFDQRFPDHKEVILATCGDWHVGNATFDERAAVDYVGKIKDSGAVVLLMGDLMENVIVGSVGSQFEQTMTPDDQIDYVVGILESVKDQIIGGVIEGNLKGYDVRSLEVDGAPVLSQATSIFSERAGKRFGGAVMQVFYHTEYTAGTYRPTFALLKTPGDLKSGDGTSYTYTVIAEKK